MIASSCQEYRDQGLRINGTYFIHPDKNVEPFQAEFNKLYIWYHIILCYSLFRFQIFIVELQIQVECQFYGNIGATIVKHHHSSETTVTSEPFTLDGCYEPGCFKDDITYDATDEQIEAIIYLSKDCSQKIIHKCSDMGFERF